MKLQTVNRLRIDKQVSVSFHCEIMYRNGHIHPLPVPMCLVPFHASDSSQNLDWEKGHAPPVNACVTWVIGSKDQLNGYLPVCVHDSYTQVLSVEVTE